MHNINFQKKRILFISSNMVPAFSGDAIFSLGLVLRLAEKYSLDVITFGTRKKWEEQPNKASINEYALIDTQKSIIIKSIQVLKFGSLLQKFSFNYVKKLKEFLAKNTYDYIIIDHLRSYSLFKSISKRINHDKTKVIYLAHNIEYYNHKQKLFQINNRIKRYLFSIVNYGIKKNEIAALKNSDILWALSSEDVDHLNRIVRKERSIVVPPHFPWKRVKTDKSLQITTKNILILGSMQWYPNVQGALHFIDEIFPKILEKDSGYKLYIVGQKPDKRLIKRKSDKIIVTGSVPSVDPYIRNSDLLVIPNKSGSGIKIKVIESLAKGLPVIMYAENARGYDFPLFKSPFVVKSPTEFADSVLSVNKNYQLKSEVVKKSIELFDKYSNFDFNL